jgi:hypothetical protein
MFQLYVLPQIQDGALFATVPTGRSPPHWTWDAQNFLNEASGGNWCVAGEGQYHCPPIRLISLQMTTPSAVVSKTCLDPAIQSIHVDN